MTTTLTVCITCFAEGAAREGQPHGERLLERLQAIAFDTNFAVRGTACLSGCSQGCTAAVQSTSKMSYLFGKLANDDRCANALLQAAEQHAASHDGQLPWAERPEALRGAVLARLPAC